MGKIELHARLPVRNRATCNSGFCSGHDEVGPGGGNCQPGFRASSDDGTALRFDGLGGCHPGWLGDSRPFALVRNRVAVRGGPGVAKRVMPRFEGMATGAGATPGRFRSLSGLGDGRIVVRTIAVSVVWM